MKSHIKLSTMGIEPRPVHANNSLLSNCSKLMKIKYNSLIDCVFNGTSTQMEGGKQAQAGKDGQSDIRPYKI